MLEVYADGGATYGSNKIGYYGWVILHQNKHYEGNGVVELTTNNQMELKAVIDSITFCKTHNLIPEDGLKVYSDSGYVIKGMNVWIHDWKKRDWKTCPFLEKKGYKSGYTIKNLHYWTTLDELVKDIKVEWTWVKGHSGNKWNDRCDELAREAKLAFYRKTKGEKR